MQDGVLIDDRPIDRIVHELKCELNPIVDGRCGHPSGVELLVNVFSVACRDLIGLDPRGGRALLQIRNHLFPYHNRGRLATLESALVIEHSAEG